MSKGVNITRYVVNGGGFLSEYFLSIIFQDKKMRKLLKEKEDEIKSKAHEIKRDYRRGLSKLGKESTNEDVKRQVGERVFKWLGYDPVIFKSHKVIRDEKDRAIGTFYEYSENGERKILFYFVGFEEHIESGRNNGYKRLKSALFRTGAKWGMVTNGRIFRLVKNEALGNAFLDIDLYRGLEDEYFEVFKLFVLLFSKDSIISPAGEKSILEIIEERCKEEASSVGTELRDTVYQAVEKIVREIYKIHPQVDLKELFEETLIYMFRLLFMFYAESVELLPVDNEIYREGYSITNLRELILNDKIKPSEEKYFVWETLNAAFKIINQGVKNSFIAVKPYNGGLFDSSKTPIISSVKLPDSVMIEIIKDISLTPPHKGKTRDRVSFRELGISQLGSIYESLLELEPKVAEEDLALVNIDGEARLAPLSQIEGAPKIEIKKGEAYLSFWGGTRKSTGTYYTPRQITEFLVKSALEEQVQGKSSEEILKIKVVDPAMGSAAFLVAAVNFLGDAYYEAVIRENEEMKDELSDEDIEELRRVEKWFLDEDVEVAKRISRRRVLENCIYGVDINPLAVDLAKVSLWLTAMEKNKPLTFLDHKLRCGNSLIGTTRNRVKEYPKEVVNLPHLKDRAKQDVTLKERLSEIKKQAKTVSKTKMLFVDESEDLDVLLNPLFGDVEKLINYRRRLMTPEENVDDIKVKEKIWYEFEKGVVGEGREYKKLEDIYDLWIALWFWEWEDLPTPREYITLVRKIAHEEEMDEREQSIMERVRQLRDKYRFFHWELEFPEVFENGGFDAAVGNPPWEKIKLQEKEFFAVDCPEIAKAKTKSDRKKLIEKLRETNPLLWEEYNDAYNSSKSQGHFFGKSGLYPLGGRGDINTYALFLELSRAIINGKGRIGMVVPTGIVTDDTYKEFFQDIVQKKSLVSVYDFENTNRIFKDVEPNVRFSLLTLSNTPTEEITFSFGLHTFEEMENPNRSFTLTIEDLELFNPNTLTCPVFSNKKVADIMRKIYHTVPVLINERKSENPWGVEFLRMFDMSNDSGLFKTKEKLEDMGYEMKCNHFMKNDDVYLPLYESKFIHHFDHRFASYEGIPPEERFKTKAKTYYPTDTQKQDPNYCIEPRYWVNATYVEEKVLSWHRKWFLGFRNAIRGLRDARSAIFTIIPYSGASNGIPLMLINQNALKISGFLSWVNSFIFDFCVKNKVSGANMNFFIVKQLPVLPPEAFTKEVLYFIVPRVIELVYTSYDIKAYADNLWKESDEMLRRLIYKRWCDNHEIRMDEEKILSIISEDNNPLEPFLWDVDRRSKVRVELDAFMAHLCNLSKEDFAYILDSFEVFRRMEEQLFGEFRTKRMCLEEYDRIGKIISNKKSYNPEMFDLSKYKKVE